MSNVADNRRILLSGILILFASVGLSARLSAQCQHQYCYFSSNRCFKCEDLGGFYCSLQRGAKCPATCTSGVCNPASTSASNLQPIPASGVATNDNEPRSASDFYVEKIAEHATKPIPAGTGLVSSVVWQKNSPAVLVELTSAYDSRTDSIAIKRVVMQNLTSSAITDYQIGWIQIYADASRKPEVHLLDPKLDRLEPKTAKEIGEPLPTLEPSSDQEELQRQGDSYASTGQTIVPPIVVSPDLRGIFVFVASVKRVGTQDFIENAEQLAEVQKARLQAAPTPRATTN